MLLQCENGMPLPQNKNICHHLFSEGTATKTVQSLTLHRMHQRPSFYPRCKISTNMLSILGGVSVKILGGRMLCGFYWKTQFFEQNLSRILSQFCLRYWKSGKEPQEKRHRQKQLRETSDITSFRPLSGSLKNNLVERSSQAYHIDLYLKLGLHRA